MDHGVPPQIVSDDPDARKLSLLFAVFYTMFSLVLLHTRINRIDILMAEFRREMLADSEEKASLSAPQ